MINYLNAYNSHGSLEDQLLFITCFGTIPSIYILNFYDEKQFIDENSICFDSIKHFFNDVIFYRLYTAKKIQENEEKTDKQPNIIEDILEDVESDKCLYIVADNMVVFLNGSRCDILYNPKEKSYDYICKLASDIFNSFPKQKEPDRTAKVGLIKFSNGEFYTDFSNIKNTDINIEENYNDDFLPVYNDLVKFLDNRESGLVLLYGKVGSGNIYIK